MSNHPAIAPGSTAVITGGASGIGLAAAKRYAQLDMNVCVADVDTGSLQAAAEEIAAQSPRGREAVLALKVDVSQLDQVERLKQQAYDRFGAVAVLMNNAGTGPGGGPWDHYDGWQRVMGVNLWGVINGVHAFTEAMIEQHTPCAIVNTGSKQGITNPPGDAAYNVSKAGVKALTESLAHKLRNTDGCQVTAHLLVPGFTYTGLTRRRVSEKPPGAWWPEQVVEELLARMGNGDFYIVCPDNDVSRETDRRRVQWAADDIIRNRPALSRWHPDFQAEFEAFARGD
jgi:NAD(P)-dependent dehydrogenase (short-subunit alcohol dehydrogenase family)